MAPFTVRMPFRQEPIEVRYDLAYATIIMTFSMVLTMVICTTVIARQLSGNIQATHDELERIAQRALTRDGDEQQLFQRMQQLETQQRVIAKEQTENTEKIRAILVAVRKAQ